MDATLATGAWSLARWGRCRNGGSPIYFDQVIGRLFYDTTGAMAACLSRASHGGGGGETRFFAYSGQWSLKGTNARHEVDLANIPEWIGTTLERSVTRLDAWSLHLETPSEAAPSGMMHDILEWTRIGAGGDIRAND